MRGIKRAPFAALFVFLAVAAMFGTRAAADELLDQDEDYGDMVLYAPQAAPADQALDLTAEGPRPVAAAPEVVLKPPARRARRSGVLSSRRTTAALTLLLAVQLNSPRFKVGLGSIPQAGATLGVLPGIAVANATRIRGTAPARRSLAARRAHPLQPRPGAGPDPKLTALFLPEEVLLH